MKEFKIFNVEIHGIPNSALAAGYPMDADNVKKYLFYDNSDLERLAKLGHAKPGSGHDCALKGVNVQMDINAPQYWWPQFQRYHFADIVSSQSKMHRLSKFDINESTNEYVLDSTKDIVRDLVDRYNTEPNKENFNYLVSNTPLGFNLTARVTTNYLQLKSMYQQRRHHKLDEWQQFCDWTESLPEFKYLILEDRIKSVTK